MASLHLAQQILDIIYPVGSIYLSTDFTNPSKKFGGTWVQVSGGYLYAAVGGSEITKGNHSGPGNGTAIGSTAITIDQMPKHSHSLQSSSETYNHQWARWANYNASGVSGNYQASGANIAFNTTTITSTGGGKGHTHSIDLVDCYMWKRTK